MGRGLMNKETPDCRLDEFIVNVKEGDFDVMSPYCFGLVADGMPCIRIDEDTIMVKYCWYSLINSKPRKIQSRLKKHA